MAVSEAEMLGAASFSRRAGIPSSPVPVDVLSSLSWQWTNAADTGFKENKDWLELFKHASVLSWFHAVKRWNTRKQLFHNICKICAEAICNSKGFCGCFSMYCDRLNGIFYNFYSVNFFFASPRIQFYMEKTFSVLCVEIMETYFSDIVKSPGKNCALLGHLPFKPKFCNFQSVHQMEWTISVWSNRNIQDQLWRYCGPLWRSGAGCSKPG